MPRLALGTNRLGFQRYRDHLDPRVRTKHRREARILPASFTGALRAMERYFRESNAALAARVSRLRSEFHLEFRAGSSIVAALGGCAIRALIRREEKRLQNGRTYRSPLFVDRRNWKPLPQR